MDVTASGWTPGPGLLDKLTDREVIDAVLADVIGKSAAASHTTETGRAKKTIILNALAGTTGHKAKAWKPRWLAFPQQRYTKRRLTALARPAA